MREPAFPAVIDGCASSVSTPSAERSVCEHAEISRGRFVRTSYPGLFLSRQETNETTDESCLTRKVLTIAFLDQALTCGILRPSWQCLPPPGPVNSE